MKKNFIYFFGIVCVIFGIGSTVVSAHLSGPPYVKIDGIYAQTNPILTYTSPVAITLGSDLATSSAYIVNRPISFEIDEQFFPNPYLSGSEKVLVKYRWDFGDGTQKLEGKIVSHTYAKSGTYVIDLEALYEGKIKEFTNVNQIQINILPHKDYILPTAKITVNGHTVTEPTKDIREIRGNRTIEFDASKSTGEIISYAWDFSDEQKGKGKIIKHTYKHSDYFPMFPVLRVTDKNGLSSDAFVFLDAPQSNNLFIKFFEWTQDILGIVLGIFSKS